MISKKDLLQEMKISYGQLYRWKREGLIPDAWFIKQAVSTGQETFFKKEDIIPRIEKILELKDKYQLEQLRDYLNPNLSERIFRIKEVMMIDVIDPFIAKKYCQNRNDLTLFDIIILYIFSENQDVLDFDLYLHIDFSHVRSLNNVFYIIHLGGYYILITDGNAIIDEKINVYKKIRFEDVATVIAKKI